MSGTISPMCPVEIGRDMAWLTAERGRLYAAAGAIVFVGVLAGMLLVQGLHTPEGLPIGMDFASFWAASRLVWAGMPLSVYNPEAHRLAESVILPGGEYEAFFYPPPYLLLCAPLGVLPFFCSLGAFMAATALTFAGAAWLATRSGWAVVAAVASPAVLVNLLTGQNAMLTAAILGAGLTLMDRRPRLAGALLGLMVIKPHLALAVPVALVCSARWRVLGAAAASAAAMAVLSALVFGLDVWSAFLANAGAARDALEQGLVKFDLFQSAFAAVREAGGSIPLSYAAQAISAAVALGVMIRANRIGASPAVERSLIVLACLLTTPFELHYDLVILMLPLLWLLTGWTETRFPSSGFPPWGKLVLLTGYLLPCAIYCWPSLHLGLFGMFALLAYLAVSGGVTERRTA
jgi:hypothetical protein